MLASAQLLVCPSVGGAYQLLMPRHPGKAPPLLPDQGGSKERFNRTLPKPVTAPYMDTFPGRREARLSFSYGFSAFQLPNGTNEP